MKLIPVTDRSPEVLQKIVKEHFSDDAEETLRLLEKIQEPYFITEGGEITGYLNLKQYQKTIYIPIYLKCLPDESEIRGLAMEIQAELRTLDHKYFVIVLRKSLPGMLNSLMKYIPVEDTVRDYRKEKVQGLYDLGLSEYRWSEAIEDVPALKALHADAYSYEKEYVIGTWDDLLDQFLSSPTPKITITCHAGERLVGSAIGYAHESHTYIYSICVAGDHQGKGIGARLMRRFINASRGKAIELKVYSNNEHAVAMYERFGFEFRDLSSLVGYNESGYLTRSNCNQGITSNH
jgi:ribosomal protein S18 acetylase RimI-like enzyme